jgi:hypothetical protein
MMAIGFFILWPVKMHVHEANELTIRREPNFSYSPFHAEKSSSRHGTANPTSPFPPIRFNRCDAKSTERLRFRSLR